MAIDRNKRRKDVPNLTIFEEKRKEKLSAIKVLELAKKQEKKKLKTHHWVHIVEERKMVLKKIEK